MLGPPLHRQRRHDADNRTIGIGHHRKAADFRDILRLAHDGAALCLELFRRGIDVVHGDITGPVRRNALPFMFLGQLHDAAHAFADIFHGSTEPDEQEQVLAQLLAYCKLDTLAMVELLEVVRGVAG